MNRRSFFTGLAMLAVWPMAIRPRPRRDLRVVEPPHTWTGEYIEGPTPITFDFERALMENRDLIEHMAWARGSI